MKNSRKDVEFKARLSFAKKFAGIQQDASSSVSTLNRFHEFELFLSKNQIKTETGNLACTTYYLLLLTLRALALKLGMEVLSGCSQIFQ